MNRRLAALGCATLLAVGPAMAGGAAEDGGGPPLAIFAAGSEAWAFSVEAGIPGPLGPLASHTVTAVDNSPHAVGAAGLADPGYLVRAAAGLMLGVPTPTYCESAHPEGPPEADCGAPAGVRVHTRSGEGPDAAATASLASVAAPDGTAPVVTVQSQSTTSTAKATAAGVEARSVVTLHGVGLAGGAVHIGALHITRHSQADGTGPGLVTSTDLAMSGVTVAGQALDPGEDAVAALAEAAGGVLGDSLRISAVEPVEDRSADGKLTAETTGLEVTWQAAPDRWVRVVLGYARTLVYAVPAVGDATVPADAVPAGTGGVPVDAGSASSPDIADAGPRTMATPPPFAASGVPEASPAAAKAATPLPAAVAPSPPPAPVAVGAMPAEDHQREQAAFELTPPAQQAVRWVSPFLVLAQMTSGGQVGWFLLALAPLLLARWGWRRTVAPQPGGR